MSGFADMIKGVRLGGPDDPPLKFEIDGPSTITAIGYSVEEIRDLLAAAREHASLSLELAHRYHEAHSGQDAVRYRPEPEHTG